MLRLARRIPFRAWLALGVFGLMIGFGLWVGHLYAEVVQLERENGRIEANHRAALDSTRLVYEAALATVEARLAVLV